MIEYVASSVKGSSREKNEDRIMVNNTVVSEGSISGKNENEFIGVVCDGVGGTDGGDIAAQMVASGFVGFNIKKASVYSLNHCIQNINIAVMNTQKQLPRYSNMTSTVAGIMFWKNRYIIFNIGDTRIYETQKDSFCLKTKDHIVGDGLLEKTQSIRRDALTRYIGGFGHVCNPNIIRGCVTDNERCFLICSDGIYKRIPEEVLRDILTGGNSLEQKKRAILKFSTQKGSIDDKSLVLIKYVA